MTETGELPQFSRSTNKGISPSTFQMDKKKRSKYNRREQRIAADLKERHNDRSTVM